MIIDADSDDSDNDPGNGEDVAGTAYKEALTSADGFTRGTNGRIKFNKDTKKRRREAAANDEDVDMDVDGEPAKSRAGQKRADTKLGREFKAKVSTSNNCFCLRMLICPIRKLGVTSRKEDLIHMHTCHWVKQQRRVADGIGLEWQESDEYTGGAFSFDLLIHAGCSRTSLSTRCGYLRTTSLSYCRSPKTCEIDSSIANRQLTYPCLKHYLSSPIRQLNHKLSDLEEFQISRVASCLAASIPWYGCPTTSF